ncbi:MAG TPA: hypothetical protein VHP81_04255 [Lachnospiraceae bacterium]|nr:hypothetical protein [Lachnospiraceae bacterium]
MRRKRMLDIATLTILVIGVCFNVMFIQNIIDKSLLSLVIGLICIGNCITSNLYKKWNGNQETVVKTTKTMSIATVIVGILWLVTLLFTVWQY